MNTVEETKDGCLHQQMEKKEKEGDHVVVDHENEALPPHVNIFQDTSIVEGKRKRKTLETFHPEDFKDDTRKNTFANLVIKQGHGVSFADIPDIRSKIDQASANDPIMEAAHKFLFGGIGGAKGSAVKKLMKSQLLEFSGYLPRESETQHTSIQDLEQKLTVCFYDPLFFSFFHSLHMRNDLFMSIF